MVDEETIGLIFDIYTEMNQVSEEEIREMREAALKKAREDGNDEEKPAKKPAKKTEEKAEKPAKKEEKKAEERKLPRLPVRIVKLYENNIAPLTPITLRGLDDWLNDMSEDVVIYAIEEAVKNNKRNYRYIEAILRNHFNAGRTTLAEVQGAKKTYHKGNEQSVYDDNGVDYDELEKIMRERM